MIVVGGSTLLWPLERVGRRDRNILGGSSIFLALPRITWRAVEQPMALSFANSSERRLEYHNLFYITSAEWLELLNKSPSDFYPPAS
jgi:hypothetical protein